MEFQNTKPETDLKSELVKIVSINKNNKPKLRQVKCFHH